MMEEEVQDVGNIVLLEHVNIEVEDPVIASVFYCDGLGLTRDPFRKGDISTTWINLGLQQFHLPSKGFSQVVNGVIGILVPGW
jgi:hypothetical protein